MLAEVLIVAGAFGAMILSFVFGLLLGRVDDYISAASIYRNVIGNSFKVMDGISAIIV